VAGFESGMGEGESFLSGPLGSLGIENGKHSKGQDRTHLYPTVGGSIFP
jgi:hypothetical protein